MMHMAWMWFRDAEKSLKIHVLVVLCSDYGKSSSCSRTKEIATMHNKRINSAILFSIQWYPIVRLYIKVLYATLEIRIYRVSKAGEIIM